MLDTVKVIETEVGSPGTHFNCIVGLESRGFIQGPMLAQHFMVPFVPIRKKGKLPGECFQQEYGTEYSRDVCEIQKHALAAGSKVLVVDDLLATGGTLKAAEDLINQIEGATISANFCLFEIPALKGKDLVSNPVVCIASLDD